MNKPNWVNRTIWTGDNLDIMRGMNSESVDLIYSRAKGGSDHIDNLQLLCGACNSLKGDRPHEWLVAELKRQKRRGGTH